MRIRTIPLLALVLATASLDAASQTSVSYKLTEHILNEGGQPSQEGVMVSSSFKLSLDALGEAVAAPALTSAAYHLAGGFVDAYLPPGEVTSIRLLSDHQTLEWDWDPASTAYNVYRDLVSTLAGEFGKCAVSRVTTNSWTDPTPPAAGTGYFYLVTGENRLWQEGTKGYRSSGLERSNSSPCP
jgi:hypothetical protein